MSDKRRNFRGNREDEREETAESIVEGRNATTEAIKAGRGFEKIFIANGSADATIKNIVSLAKEHGIPVVYCDRRKIDQMSTTGAHQGVLGVCSATEYVSLEDILQTAADRNEKPLLILCDGITDVHNLGAILRTAEAAGAHGVVIQKRRSAGVNAVVEKTSAGASSYIPVCRVANLTAAINELKENGVWIYGTAMDGDRTLYDSDLAGACAFVIGSEGEGMSRLVREQCDFTVNIPMYGKINSLNASAAASVMLYEAVRQRHYKNK